MKKGFTIVELLIVIIVIAILASISLVAYGGIQDKAKVTKKRADISNIMKSATAAALIDGGQYSLDSSMSQADKDHTLNSLNLSSFSEKLVIDDEDPLGGPSCTSTAGSMTKEKYCIGLSVDESVSGHVVWWNDEERVWTQTDFDGATILYESDAGTGDLPNNISYGAI